MARHLVICKRRTDLWKVRCGVLLFAVLSVAGCGSQAGSRQTSASSDILRVGLPEGNIASDELGVGQFGTHIKYEALTAAGEDGRALPRLAESWAWERDDRRLRIRLRRDVTLHDGRDFDAHLAAEALARAIPRASSQYPALRDITAAIPDGRFQLLIDLRRPSAQLPEDLAVFLEEYPAGPFRELPGSDAKIKEYERFDRHYSGVPAIRRVIIRGFDTLRTTWSALLRNELDMVSDIPADAVEFVGTDDVQIVSFDRWYQFLFVFNSHSPVLRSPLVRRALNVAIDRRHIIDDVLEGTGTPSAGPIWPKYWAYDQTVGSYAYDPQLAVRLLEEAGFTMQPGDDLRPPARLRFTCLIPENFSVWERIALEVQKSLFNVGVDMQFQVVRSLDGLNQQIPQLNYDAVLLDAISGPTPGRAYIWWASAERFRGRVNIFGYANPEADRLFEILHTTRNEAAVRSSTRRLQRVLMDDPPALFVAWNSRARAIRRDFVVVADPGRDPFLTLSRWTLRASPMRIASAP